MEPCPRMHQDKCWLQKLLCREVCRTFFGEFLVIPLNKVLAFDSFQKNLLNL